MTGGPEASISPSPSYSIKERCKLFVGGLHWLTTEESLRKHFERFGTVLECVLMHDATGKSRCFGFVTFDDPSVSEIVVRQIHILDGKQIDPKHAVRKNMYDPSFDRNDQISSASLQEAKIFVGNLPGILEEPELVEAFTVFGKVVDGIIMRDKDTRRSKGFGFITFSTKSEAKKAAFAGSIELKGRKIDIRLALPKEKMAKGAQDTSLANSSEPQRRLPLAPYVGMPLPFAHPGGYPQPDLAAASAAYYYNLYYGMPPPQIMSPYAPIVPLDQRSHPSIPRSLAYIENPSLPAAAEKFVNAEALKPSIQRTQDEAPESSGSEKEDDDYIRRLRRRRRLLKSRSRSLSPSSRPASVHKL